MEDNENKKIVKIMIQYSDENQLIDITDLPKNECENFLEYINQLRLCYLNIISHYTN